MNRLRTILDEPSSFRDPAGSVFWMDGAVYRQVNSSYESDYDLLMSSGLRQALLKKNWLVEHHEVTRPVFDSAKHYKTIKPRLINFVSYPYEWSFSQLKDAALLTLDIQTSAIKYGMTLKDASAYNIQFVSGKPTLIDTLSFKTYVEGKPWGAYRQFCQHFLAPLALMAYTDVRLSQLFRIFIDGIPLDLTTKLLPSMSWTRWGLIAHVHLHAKAQKTYSDIGRNSQSTASQAHKLSRHGMIGLLGSLRSTVEKLEWKPHGTEWVEYYQATNYSDGAFREKEKIVEAFIDCAAPSTLWDMGANTGVFSRIAAKKNIPTVAFDIDPAAVESNYRQMKSLSETSMLPLVLDLTNPSSSIGWASKERRSLAERGPVDCVMALALVHHLAISNNVPLSMIAEFFASICKRLIIEFVPKNDSQVQRLLRTRKDIFPLYDEVNFESEFGVFFRIEKKIQISGSNRTLYLMESI
jgi:hypothetical protein